MPQKKNWLIISFANTTEALRAEKLFTTAGITGMLIPTPRNLSSSCGLTWRTNLAERAAIEAQITEHRLMAEAVLEMLI